MEPRSPLLRGIAKALNAGGSALVDIYDAATTIKTSVVPGETEKLKAKIGEYEKKIERLYYQIGKEVAQREYTGQTPAVAEAGIKLVAEYRGKIEKIKQGIKIIEEKAATKAATDRAGAKAEPAAHTGGNAASDAPAAGDASTGVGTEEEKGAEAAETQAQEIDMSAAASARTEAGEVTAAAQPEGMADIPGEVEATPQKLPSETADAGVPVADDPSPGTEMKREAASEELHAMLKGELLKICVGKGIDADQRMTKAAIIELIKKGRV